MVKPKNNNRSTKVVKRKGRKLTMKKSKGFGKNKNFTWKIVSNQPSR